PGAGVGTGEPGGAGRPAGELVADPAEGVLVQAHHDAEGRVGVAGAHGPGVRGPHVVEVGVDAAGPGTLLRATQLGPGPLGQRRVPAVVLLAAPLDVAV